MGESRRPHPQQTADKLLVRLERDERILELMRRGKGTTAIAREVGMGTAQVTTIRKRLLTEAADEMAVERRLWVAESMMRLNALLDAVWDPAMAGNVKYVTEARLIIAEMAAYTDAKAPVKVNIVDAPSEVDLAIQQLSEALDQRARDAAREADPATGAAGRI